MIKIIKKFIKINFIIFRNSYIRDSKIFGWIVINIFSQLFDIIVSLLLFVIIFNNTETLAGWNLYQVLFLYSFIKFTGSFHAAWTRGGVKDFSNELVRMGDYDFYTTKPYDPMVLVTLKRPKIYTFVAVFFEMGLMIYAATHSGIAIGFSNLFWFLFLTILSLILFYFLEILTVVPAFWTTRIWALTDLMNRAIQFAKYPTAIFPVTLRIILSTLFPILVVSYFPARTLFYPPEFKYIIYMLLITILFGFITKGLWKLGEKRYGSASS